MKSKSPAAALAFSLLVACSKTEGVAPMASATAGGEDSETPSVGPIPAAAFRAQTTENRLNGA